HPTLIVHVDEVGGVALAVVRLARALPAVRLARIFADVGGGPGRAQEGGQVARQSPHGRHADHPVTRTAPGLDLNGGRRDQHQGGGGNHQAFDLSVHETAPSEISEGETTAYRIPARASTRRLRPEERRSRIRYLG